MLLKHLKLLRKKDLNGIFSKENELSFPYLTPILMYILLGSNDYKYWYNLERTHVKSYEAAVLKGTCSFYWPKMFIRWLSDFENLDFPVGSHSITYEQLLACHDSERQCPKHVSELPKQDWGWLPSLMWKYGLACEIIMLANMSYACGNS